MKPSRASGGRQSPDGGGSDRMIGEATTVLTHQGADAAPLAGTTQLVGRTKCDRIVVFDGNPRLAGTLAQVTIHDCTQTTLVGAIVTQQVHHGSHELLPILST
jgi:tRNA A37 methylthiotransferase MiaB